MTTVDELLQEHRANGIRGRFACRPLTHVECRTCGAESLAADVRVLDVQHIENEREDAVVAAIECPACHARGAHVFARGESAPEEEAAVLLMLLEDHPTALL